MHSPCTKHAHCICMLVAAARASAGRGPEPQPLRAGTIAGFASEVAADKGAVAGAGPLSANHTLRYTLMELGSGAVKRRQMRLTEDLVARVPLHSGQSGRLAGRSDLPTEAEYAAAVAALLMGAPASGEVWVFAFGSLIWSPGFDHVEERLATLHGWRRSFCIGWVRIYRGTPERPGIMLGLDRGGCCRGVAFRLPPDAVRENLETVFRREHPVRWDTPHMRWVTARTEKGPVRALAVLTKRSQSRLSRGSERRRRRRGLGHCGRRAGIDGGIPALHDRPSGGARHSRSIPVADAGAGGRSAGASRKLGLTPYDGRSLRHVVSRSGARSGDPRV
jgi:glutathione-specific gamma-glutamylcyclotransferase